MVLPPNQTVEGYKTAFDQSSNLLLEVERFEKALENNVHEHGQYLVCMNLLERAKLNLQTVHSQLKQQLLKS